MQMVNRYDEVDLFLTDVATACLCIDATMDFWHTYCKIVLWSCYEGELEIDHECARRIDFEL